jgi:hypothetical protein
MVEATSAGISAPKAFNTEEFLKTFESQSGAASAKGTAAAASGVGASTPGSSAAPPGATPAAMPDIPPPQLAPPPQLPPEQQKQADAMQAAKDEAEKRKIRLLAFRAAAVYFRPPESDPVRLVAVSWTPSIPIPFIPVEVRGQAGGGFFRNGSLNDGTFVLHEYHVFVGQTFLRNFVGEFGFGWQFFRNQNDAGRSVTLNLGYIFGPQKFFNHVFVGQSLLYPFRREQITIHQTRVGIGLVVF